MLTVRRIRTRDDDGSVTDDFMAGHVIHKPKRSPGFVLPDDPLDRKIVCMEAVAVLDRLNWPAEKIAVAMNCTDRTVRKWRSMNRQVAEGYGAEHDDD